MFWPIVKDCNCYLIVNCEIPAQTAQKWSGFNLNLFRAEKKHYDASWTSPVSDAHTQRAFFSEGLLSWLGSRDLLETLAFPETLNWSQKGVCKHLLISSDSAGNPSVTRELKPWHALWPTVLPVPFDWSWKIQFKFKPKSQWVWQWRNHTVPECKHLKLGLCIRRQMWDCTNASWSVPALKVNNSEELSNPVWHGGKWVTFSYAKHGTTNENYNYGHVILF